MELQHEFTVPASVEDTWTVFNDLAMVAGCFPGATLTAVEGDTFTGTCKVKLGPISLVYSGSGTFLERDGDAHRFVLEARGKDKRGNGTAGATVTAVLTAVGPDTTEASVTTDLSITGKPAQFGRGVIQDVSDKLLNQFVACLESKVGGEEPSEQAEQDPGHDPGQESATCNVRHQSAARTGAERCKSPGDQVDRAPATASRDALDLGATVVPILLRTYWRHLAGVALVLLVLRRVLGSRRGSQR